ncbi:M15 family metallopeptidase [Radiobacillus kanasensis]|uniref:M15 family metallopeptidase n=1 Tax=Radiobacillus kanasensis TaxID=2844358 RepID=UPI001E40941E|nr:M15 family metallopeptidase [Radiobacillus kanasensis]UFT99676.1 M15 family metallopeptidase [Radiobacillus kanasensis]
MLRKSFPLFLILISIFVFFLFYENRPFFKHKDVPMPTELHPVVASKKEQLIEEAAKIGINILITDGWRSIEVQNQLYEQGRTEDGSIVTNVQGGESYHNYGLAIDFAIKLENGDVIWDMTYDGNKNKEADWMEVVGIAKSLGFEWGGDWNNFKDYPHFQIDFGLSIWELQRGERPSERKVEALNN